MLADLETCRCQLRPQPVRRAFGVGDADVEARRERLHVEHSRQSLQAPP